MKRNHVAVGVGALLSGAIMVFHGCETTAPPTGNFAFVSTSDKAVSFSNAKKCSYDSLSIKLAVTGPTTGSTTFSIASKPLNATFNSTTGDFGWRPTIFDFGVTTLVFSAENNGAVVRDTVAITAAKPTLDSGEVYRLLTPNGGETYKYGDSVTLVWIQNYRQKMYAELEVSSDNGRGWCYYYDTRQAAPHVDADTIPTAIKYYRIVNDSIAVGRSRIALTDRDVADCPITFMGAQMRFHVGDQYPPRIYDASDTVFTIQ